MNFRIDHTNLNVADLAQSLGFYRAALGMEEQKRIEVDGFILVFLTNNDSHHRIELTYCENNPPQYKPQESVHIAFKVDDYNAAYEYHKKMGCVCGENHARGMYYIADPDGYWMEILRK